MSKDSKKTIEILLEKIELNGVPEKRVLKSRHLGTVELIWPKVGSARKSASRQMNLKFGKADFTSEPWAKRVLFREEIDGKCGIAVGLTDALTVQKVRKFLLLIAKYALKETGDIVSDACISYGDIAAAPFDALATMAGTAYAPKTIAQGLVDFTDLPAEGETKKVVVPLVRPLTGKEIGSLALEVRG